jgi:hypothetical protein
MLEEAKVCSADDRWTMDDTNSHALQTTMLFKLQFTSYSTRAPEEGN